MELNFWRDQSFYKDIIKLQNVKLVHPSVNPRDILEKCDLVTTIAGTVGLEALFFEKPVANPTSVALVQSLIFTFTNSPIL